MNTKNTDIPARQPMAPKYRIHQPIAFNPTWLNERGWMVNVPLLVPMSELGLIAPANIGDGVYEAKREFNGRRPDDTVLLRFEIHYDQVRQELPHGRSLIYRPGRVEIYTGGEGRQLEEVWIQFVDVSGEQHWFMSKQQRLMEFTEPADLVPADFGSCLARFVQFFYIIEPQETEYPALVWLTARAATRTEERDRYIPSRNRWLLTPTTNEMAAVYREARVSAELYPNVSLLYQEELRERMKELAEKVVAIIKPISESAGARDPLTHTRSNE